MTVSRKAAFSLLISVVLFAAFSALAFTRLFDAVETRFYNPAAASSLSREIEADTDALDLYLGNLTNRFAAALKEEAVRRSFLPDQADEDIYRRSRFFGILHENSASLQWVRFVDARGIRIHFSTYPQDLLRQDAGSLAYQNYNDVIDRVPFETVAAAEGGGPKIITGTDRILFSFPFYDSYDVYRGTALFSVSVRGAAERLVSLGRIKAGEEVSAIAEPPGLLTGMPRTGRGALGALVSRLWADGHLDLSILDAADTASSLVLVSSKTSQGIYTGRLTDASLLAMPPPMKIILLVSFFLTVYLVMFLLFNLRQDPFMLIQKRLKRLQFSLMKQFFDQKIEMDWTRWGRELEQRRDEIRAAVKQGIHLPPAAAKEADILINKSWNELTALIGGRWETQAVAALPPEAFSAAEEEPEILEELEEYVEEFGELEPIDEDEEVEVLEELADDDNDDEPQTGKDPASQIEFSAQGGEEDTVKPMDKNLEIVSPFKTILSPFSGKGDDTHAT